MYICSYNSLKSIDTCFSIDSLMLFYLPYVIYLSCKNTITCGFKTVVAVLKYVIINQYENLKIIDLHYLLL